MGEEKIILLFYEKSFTVLDGPIIRGRDSYEKLIVRIVVHLGRSIKKVLSYIFNTLENYNLI